MTPAAISTLRAGDEVAGVFACTRKDRLLSRAGAPYLAVELRDRTGALPGRDGLQKQPDAHQSLENARLWLILKSGSGPH